MSLNCYFDVNGCYVCPAIPASPAMPYSKTVDSQLGWNAGADSIVALAGDMHVVWSIDTLPSGVALGLKSQRLLPAVLALLDHGLFIYPVAGQAFVQVIENGKTVGAAQAYALTTPLEVRRVGALISYWNNSVLITTTPASTTDPMIVNTCLYCAGDSVP